MSLPVPSPQPQLDLSGTELRLGLPGSESPDRAAATLELLPRAVAKRGFADAINAPRTARLDLAAGSSGGGGAAVTEAESAWRRPAAAGEGVEKKTPPNKAKAQAVGWPPIRNYWKNTLAINLSKMKEEAEVSQIPGCLYVKVSMDGAPYLRKVHLNQYKNYKELSSALATMFSCFTIGQHELKGNTAQDGASELVITYEDKDGDWMLVGDLPWEMFVESCRRLRIMKAADTAGLGPRKVSKATVGTSIVDSS